ncbi:hypothetical protein E2C01_045397 [Portunus trituberculatus]|uniref:Uncharacterized protein n=1 Tax=Portunus trituberculatus TaxID=210409 RepID=A0A5B7G1Y9_PORTR|nr:hypothetical protein [Portunus trituberculatus]
MRALGSEGSPSAWVRILSTVLTRGNDFLAGGTPHAKPSRRFPVSILHECEAPFTGDGRAGQPEINQSTTTLTCTYTCSCFCICTFVCWFPFTQAASAH